MKSKAAEESTKKRRRRTIEEHVRFVITALRPHAEELGLLGSAARNA